MIKKIIDSFKALRMLVGEKRDAIEIKKAEKQKQEKGNFRIHGDSSVNAEIGEYTYVAVNSLITNCKIGKFCSIGPNVVIGYGEHPTNFISTSPVFYLKENIAGTTFTNQNLFESDKKVIIKNDVWIGANVYIKNGVSIGNGVVVAAGAVVVDDVPDYAIVGGVPAKLIRYRFTEEVIKSLLKMQWWDFPEDKLKKYHAYFVDESSTAFLDQFRKEL